MKMTAYEIVNQTLNFIGETCPKELIRSLNVNVLLYTLGFVNGQINALGMMGATNDELIPLREVAEVIDEEIDRRGARRAA